MRDDVRHSREQSTAAFVRVVWPVLQRECPELRGSVLRLVESRSTNVIAHELDVYAGIDAYQRMAPGLRGIALRVQWWKNRKTFTVRVSRPSGALTEFRKRMIAIKRREEGFVYPHWTIQAYVSTPDGSGILLAVAVAKTVELYRYIEQRARCGRPCPLFTVGRSGERFLAVDWEEYQQTANYCFVYTLPDPPASISSGGS